MTRLLLTVTAALLWAQIAFAQATPGSQLAWDQPNATLADAQAYTYRYYPDGAATGTVLPGVTCTASGAVITCATAFPAFTPGPHSLQLSASNAAGEGPKGAAFAFTFVVVPSAPVNTRIQ